MLFPTVIYFFCVRQLLDQHFSTLDAKKLLVLDTVEMQVCDSVHMNEVSHVVNPLKDKFTWSVKFHHHLPAPMQMESQVNFHRPHNIPEASKQNSIAAFF